MTTKVRVGGAWKDISGGSVRVSGSWRRLTAIKAYFDSAWRTVAVFADSLSLSLSASSISRTGANSTVTSAAVLATPTGGSSPFTYAWAKQSGGLISATNPTSAQTTFRATNMTDQEERSAVFRCTCTDAYGSTATADVTVTLTRIAIDFSGGNL